GVDVSPARRLETVIANICRGAIATAAKQRSIEKALAREIMLAAEGNPDSFAVSKKEDKERQAEAAHN
ncbi:MAG: 30S ribosomal protein S7, partial [Candidatus Poseidoniia archaeon]|nr:30S ribosomal protein S7 [Candidatus Poseidoniia archaeon]